jgi:LysR family hydrogen peroxide-inducible transcriptional activator
MPEYAPLPVTLRQLQYVLAVAETGSFHGAAARCHVSQPGLSTQVKALEEALGVTVFERAPRAVRVTAEGERVLERARRLLDEAVALAEDARQCRDPFARALSVGVIPTVAPYVLTRVTPALRAAHPALRVRWVEDKTSALVRDIAAGVLDGALLALEAELPGMATAEVTRDPFVLACAPSHPLARRRAKVTLDDVRGLDLLLLDEGHCLRDQVLSLCHARRAEELPFRATSLATLVQMVAAGDAATLLPRVAVEVENRASQLVLRPVEGGTLGRTLGFAWRRGAPVGAVFEALAAIARRALS